MGARRESKPECGSGRHARGGVEEDADLGGLGQSVAPIKLDEKKGARRVMGPTGAGVGLGERAGAERVPSGKRRSGPPAAGVDKIGVGSMVKQGKAARHLAEAQGSKQAWLAGGGGDAGGGAVKELGVGVGSCAQEKGEHAESIGAAEPALVDSFANGMVGASQASEGETRVGATGEGAFNKEGVVGLDALPEAQLARSARGDAMGNEAPNQFDRAGGGSGNEARERMEEEWAHGSRRGLMQHDQRRRAKVKALDELGSLGAWELGSVGSLGSLGSAFKAPWASVWRKRWGRRRRRR